MVRKQTQSIGRYEIGEPLGQGGMAEIFKAKLRGGHAFEKTLVLKCLLPEFERNTEFLDMFTTEARLMAQMDHPNVVKVLDFGRAAGRYYMAMEYIRGLDLRKLLGRCVRRRIRPPTAISVHIVAEILNALDYAHNLTDASGELQRIVHRDISPANIFISHLGEVKLGDFGIARATMRTETTQVGEIKGKYGYVAPEMVRGDDFDARADVFSAGVVLAELMIVRRLFLGRTDLDTALQIRDGNLDRLYQHGRFIPPDLMRIIEPALARDPQTRYQNAAVFREALRRFLYDRHLMVHANDVRDFVRSIRQKGPPRREVLPPPPIGLHPETSSTEYSVVSRRRATPSSTRAAGEDLEVLGTHRGQALTAAKTPQRSERPTQPLRVATNAVGKKRRIALTPPPEPPPVPMHLSQTQERSRLSTQHAYEAIKELEREADEAITAVDSMPPELATPNTTPPEFDDKQLEAIAASRMASSEGLPPDAQPDKTGRLNDTSLVRLLFDLALAEETGLLVLEQGQILKEVYLVDGDPRYVSSNKADELFGQFLVREKVLNEQQLSVAIAMLPHFDDRLGDALVGLKLLSAIDVARYLTQQVRQKLLVTFAWDGGTYRYYAGAQCKRDAAPLGWDAFECLGAAVELIPAGILRQRISARLSKLAVPNPSASVPPEVFRVGPLARRVWEQFDGSVSPGEAIEACPPDDRHRAMAIVYLLLETRLLSA